jgi:ethanolamine ammonia-lyase small subunit
VHSLLWSFPPFKGQLDEVLSYLLRTFGRVKGKDYVRKLMSRSKASLLVGTRPGLAVTSLTARVKAEKEHRKDMVAAEEENNAMRAVIRELYEDEEDSS